MENNLKKILTLIGEEYKDKIFADSGYYLEVDIGKQAEKLGYDDLKNKYQRVGIVVPIKMPEAGMKVMIDGRTFVRYAQFDSGIASPEYIAKEAEMAYKPYVPKESMVLNFA
ncbi:MAG: hypothetical protein ABIK92_01590 [Pseudomonadota bacterium]